MKLTAIVWVVMSRLDNRISFPQTTAFYSSLPDKGQSSHSSRFPTPLPLPFLYFSLLCLSICFHDVSLFRFQRLLCFPRLLHVFPHRAIGYARFGIQRFNWWMIRSSKFHFHIPYFFKGSRIRIWNFYSINRQIRDKVDF